MKKQVFFNILGDIFEEDFVEMNDETNLAELADSLSVLSVMALADAKFDRNLTTDELVKVTTIKSLMELIGMENFD